MRNGPKIIISLAGGLALGFVAGVFLFPRFTKAPASACAPCPKQEQAPTPASAPKELKIISELFMPADGSSGPSGYRIKMSGAINQSFLLTQELDEQKREDFPLLKGETLKKDEYYWAGLRTVIMFVKDGGRLQIQREFEPEDLSETAGLDAEADREVLWEMALPPDTKVVFE